MARPKQVPSLGVVQLLWFCAALEIVCTITDNCDEECDTLTEDQLKQYKECPPDIYKLKGDINLTCNESLSLSQPEEIVWLKDGIPLNVTGMNFSKTQIQLSDSGNYTCQLGGQTLNSQRVQVEEALSNISPATCSATSRGRFNISWHGDSSVRVPTLYQMVLTYSQDSSQCRQCTFTSTSKSHLFVFKNHIQGHYGKITARNCLMSDWTSSSIFHTDTNCLLKTLPPRNVQLMAISTSSINVTFDLPEEWTTNELMTSSDSFVFSYNQSMIYNEELMVKIENDITKLNSPVPTETVTYILKVHDEAYSKVCVRVGLKVSDMMPDFSEFSCVRLKMAKPSSYPKEFVMTNSTADKQDREKRTVEFQWQPLSLKEANGIITSYRLTLQRISDPVEYHEFNISSDKTSYKVKDLLSRYMYEAKLYASNSVGESDPTPVLTVSSQNQSDASAEIAVLLVSLIILSLILCSARTYFKVKKRVRPNIPEPVYYSKLHMTQLQNRELPEPEVFDALNPSPTNLPTDMLEDGIGETTRLSNVLSSQDQATDYSYTQFESSNGSTVHERSRDFTGLQTGGNQDIQHNTYTALPSPNSEVLPDGETHLNRRGVQQTNSQEESLLDAAEGYSMLGLIPSQEETGPASSTEKPGQRKVDRNEDTHCMKNKPDYRQGEMETATAKTGTFSSRFNIPADDCMPTYEGRPTKPNDLSSRCYIPADDCMPTYEGRPTMPNDLSRKTDPYVSKDMLGVGQGNHHKGQLPFNIASSSKTSSSPEVNSVVRDHKEFQKVDCDPYVHHQHAVIAPPSQRPSNLFSNLDGTVAGGTTNPSDKSVDPNTRQIGMGVTLSKVEQVAGFSEQYNSSQLPDLCHSNVQNRSGDSYISKDHYVPNGQDIKVGSDEYIGHADPDVGRVPCGFQTDLFGNTIQAKCNSPNHPAIHEPKRCKDQQFDPYVLHSSLSAEQSILASAHPFRLVEKSSRNSEIPGSTSQSSGHSDPYIAHECAALRSKTQRLHPSSEAIPTESAINDKGASVSLVKSSAPYVSHSQSSDKSCILTTDCPLNQERESPKKTDRPCKPDITRNLGIKGYMSENNETSDPYVPHECAAIGSASQVLSEKPHNSRDFGITRSIAKDNDVPDHYVPHERAAVGPETQRKDVLPSQKVGENRDSTMSAVNPSLAKQVTDHDDPYISHSDASRGSCLSYSSNSRAPNSDSCVTSSNGPGLLHQEVDPYISRDAVASGSQFGTKPDSDPHECKLSDGAETAKSGERFDDPYIPHRMLEGKTKQQHVPLVGDGYVSHDAVSGKE